MDHETRSVAGAFEVRQDAETRTLTGYAAVFNTETTIAGLFREQIRPGAFADATKTDDVRALWNHDPNYVLGRTTAGTLRLEEDSVGLRYTVTLPDTQWARDLAVSVARGDVTQSSFGFSIDDGGQEWTPAASRTELPLRTITRARLYDVSPVTYPAYADTSVSARDAAAALSEQVPVEPTGVDETQTRLRLLRVREREV